MAKRDILFIFYVFVCSSFTLVFAVAITLLSVFLPILEKITHGTDPFSTLNAEGLMSNVLIIAITLSIITIASFIRHILLYSEFIKTNLGLYVIVLFPLLLIIVGLQLVNMYYWLSSVGKAMDEPVFKIAKFFTIVSLVVMFALELFISVRNEVSVRILQAQAAAN